MKIRAIFSHFGTDSNSHKIKTKMSKEFVSKTVEVFNEIIVGGGQDGTHCDIILPKGVYNAEVMEPEDMDGPHGPYYPYHNIRIHHRGFTVRAGQASPLDTKSKRPRYWRVIECSKQKFTEYQNLTPHSLNFIATGGESIHIPTSGPAARCKQIETLSEQTVDYGNSGYPGDTPPIPVMKIEFGETTNLPDPKKGMALIVSQIVVASNPDRDDLFYPSGLVRDEMGKIQGFTKLGK